MDSKVPDRPKPDRCDYCSDPLPVTYEYVDNRKYDQEWYFCDKDCMISYAIESHPIGAIGVNRKRRDPERM